jgi:hypothetical protein
VQHLEFSHASIREKGTYAPALQMVQAQLRGWS